MRIEEIRGTDKIEEFLPLLAQHRDELATHKHLMVVKPDMEKYRAMEDNGLMTTLALYDGDRIVGYSVIFFFNNLHYADLIYAQNDVLFVHPRYRNGLWGVRLIKRTERIAKQRGAQMILFHGKPNTVFSSLMPRLGYGVQDIMFSKEL